MVSAYPGLFYPGQVYPGQVDTGPPPPPPPPTPWGSWILARTGTPIRRATRVLVWPGGAAGGHLLTDTGAVLTTETADRFTV